MAPVSSLFPKTFYDFSPRVGFAYQPTFSPGFVFRGGIGMFFDQPNLNPFLDNRPPNGGASGAESNPGGPAPVSSLSNSNIVISPNTLLFPINTAYDPNTNYNLFSISPNLRPAYTFNFNFNIEKSLGSKAIFNFGYVGSQSRKLLSNIDINQSALGTTPLGTTAQTQPSLRQAIPELQKHQPGLQHRQLQLQFSSDHDPHDKLAPPHRPVAYTWEPQPRLRHPVSRRKHP